MVVPIVMVCGEWWGKDDEAISGVGIWMFGAIRSAATRGTCPLRHAVNMSL